MRQTQTTLEISTPGQGLVEITRPVSRWVVDQGMATGLLTVFVSHTSASLTLQENADPDVAADLNDFFKTLVREDPENEGLYRHCNEGPDDMPAHIKSMLTDTSVAIPVNNGRPVFGTWQGLFLFEHRTRPHIRRVTLHFIGD